METEHQRRHHGCHGCRAALIEPPQLIMDSGSESAATTFNMTLFLASENALVLLVIELLDMHELGKMARVSRRCNVIIGGAWHLCS